MKKVLSITLAAVLLLSIAIPVKLFLIGDPLDAAQVHYTITEEGDALRFHVSTAASAIAFRGWNYRQEGNTLYIRARKVLVSPLFPSGVYTTTITPEVLTEIYFGGDLIWQAGQGS